MPGASFVLRSLILEPERVDIPHLLHAVFVKGDPLAGGRRTLLPVPALVLPRIGDRRLDDDPQKTPSLNPHRVYLKFGASSNDLSFLIQWMAKDQIDPYPVHLPL